MVRLGESLQNARYIIGLIGTCEVRGDADIPVAGICIDSREAGENALFIPLKGERVDGHDYIDEAHKNGARTFFIGKHRHSSVPDLSGQFGDSLFLLVEDTLETLQEMARRHVAAFGHIVRIGITGSSGKTTTKECVVSILSGKGKVVCNPGNLNSDIGLPLSVMAVSSEDEYAVFEMGVNRVGEMDILAGILKPQYVIITNIGTAHIGILGSREAIAREKRKSLEYLSSGDHAVLWEDDEYLGFLSEVLSGPPTLFGREVMKGICSAEMKGLEGAVLEYRDIGIRFPLPGRYNVLNAMAAIRIAELMGAGADQVKTGLESVSPLFGRGQVIRGKVTILSDCYNANLESMKASIDFFSSLEGSGVKHYVLASMKELGDAAESAHADLGDHISRRVSKDQIFLFGKEMQAAYKVLRNSSNVFWTDDFGVLENRLVKSLGPGDFVLLKGSRSMELERLVASIKSGIGENALC